jgi:hypothetical protein
MTDIKSMEASDQMELLSYLKAYATKSEMGQMAIALRSIGENSTGHAGADDDSSDDEVAYLQLKTCQSPLRSQLPRPGNEQPTTKYISPKSSMGAASILSTPVLYQSAEKVKGKQGVDMLAALVPVHTKTTGQSSLKPDYLCHQEIRARSRTVLQPAASSKTKVKATVLFPKTLTVSLKKKSNKKKGVTWREHLCDFNYPKTIVEPFGEVSARLKTKEVVARPTSTTKADSTLVQKKDEESMRQLENFLRKNVKPNGGPRIPSPPDFSQLPPRKHRIPKKSNVATEKPSSRAHGDGQIPSFKAWHAIEKQGVVAASSTLVKNQLSVASTHGDSISKDFPKKMAATNVLSSIPQPVPRRKFNSKCFKECELELNKRRPITNVKVAKQLHAPTAVIRDVVSLDQVMEAEPLAWLDHDESNATVLREGKESTPPLLNSSLPGRKRKMPEPIKEPPHQAQQSKQEKLQKGEQPTLHRTLVALIDPPPGLSMPTDASVDPPPGLQAATASTPSVPPPSPPVVKMKQETKCVDLTGEGGDDCSRTLPPFVAKCTESSSTLTLPMVTYPLHSPWSLRRSTQRFSHHMSSAALFLSLQG